MTVPRMAKVFPTDSSRPSFDSDGETATSSDFDEEPALTEKYPIYTALPTWRRILRASSGLSEYLRVSRILTLLTETSLILLPSYVSRRLTRTPAKRQPLHVVSALDGLRGLACLFVFNEHLSYNFSHTFLYGYGIEDRRTISQLPFVRIFWSGFSMVAVFYVISGYVLSYKPLKQIRSKSSQFHHTMASSIFRRALRLYLPSIIAVFVCGLMLQAGAFKYASQVYENEKRFELHEATPPYYDGFWAQMVDCAKNAFRMMYFWSWDNDTSPGDYDLHLWTIPTEFRCSMVLFVTLIAVSRLRQIYRLTYVIGFIIYCVATDRRDIILFMFGMLLAEVDMIRNDNQQTTPPLALVESPSKPNKRWILWIMLFILGVFLASAPTIGSEATPGYQLFAALVPSCYGNGGFFLQSAGAILTTWAVANSKELQPLFTNAFAQYLGQISYALYLVHGNLLKSLLYAIMPTISSITGGGVTMRSFVLGWFIGLCILFPITLWAADLYWRAVDIPCVKFARWTESAMSDPWPAEEGSGPATGSL